ncbi:hypothetical protein AGR4C_pb20125 [Agrobacterium tumefaciens str. Kerr 14]|uniref:IstB-like ATP-binding domain-containing protein n=1 Tax=Agrobacterium tumefaciens str. Kerr 14 TaxID=1183424 RepID=A0A1S7SE73_AGRTU|nr:hypothetical protein AGR4C_pb20125 [Agrobacterium tumefaciens str. Kerr 14]
MERSQILDMMGTLKLFGMRSAYDETMASGIKRQHEPPRIVGDLLQSEIAEKQARSIKYQITLAKLPLAKDIDDFDFTNTPVNEGLVRQLATGAFLAEQHNIVLVGGTDLPSRLQRYEGVFEFVLLRPPSRTQGHRRHGHMPHARSDTDQVFRARRHARYGGRPSGEGRSG